MYEAYFGFSQRPFTAAPLANRYFPAASVDAARQMLARCIERGAGAGVLIGPPGTGKSLLLQVLAGQFADKMAAVQLAGGQLESRRALLQAILFELRLPYRGLEEGELRLALVDHLTRGDKCPQGMLLFVDEAQTLPTLLLEELRMMTNLARGGETRVRLVLAGSMELEELLAGPDLQAFAQRLAARCYLEAFDRAETIDYLRFQVAVAGGQADARVRRRRAGRRVSGHRGHPPAGQPVVRSCACSWPTRPSGVRWTPRPSTSPGPICSSCPRRGSTSMPRTVRPAAAAIPSSSARWKTTNPAPAGRPMARGKRDRGNGRRLRQRAEQGKRRDRLLRGLAGR